MVAWRIGTRRGEAAVSGEGARLYGGRWNRVGLAAVYASEHLSLAALETLVHVDTDTPPKAMWVIRLDLPDDLPTAELRPADLEAGWRAPGSPSCREIGSAWLCSAEHAALVVPSAVLPEERNVILNPEHPGLRDGVAHEVTRRFSFDSRLPYPPTPDPGSPR